MKKKIIVSLAALLVLAVSVIGFYSVQAVGDNTPEAKAIWLPPIGEWAAKYPGCDTECGGAPLDIWEGCMASCILL